MKPQPKAENLTNQTGIKKNHDSGVKPEKNQILRHFFEKKACKVKKNMLSCKGCGMIAVKREVAAYKSRFSAERMSS